MGTMDEKTIDNVPSTDSFQPKFVSKLNVVNNVSARIWHDQLSHLSFKRLETLKSQLQCKTSTYGDKIHVIFAHWLNKEGYPFLHTIICQNLLLIWSIVMYGIPIISVLTLATDLQIFLDIS